MKTIKRLLCALLCAALLLPAIAAAEGGRGILYKVTGGKNAMYLLGSIHVGSEDMYPISDAISDALAGSDVVIMECDTESGDMAVQMINMMTYPIGETLEQNISSETWELLQQVAEKSGNPISMYMALRPWAVTSMFAVEQTAAEMGVDDVTEAMRLGVETQLGAMAGDKPRAYLETATDQLEAMDSLSPELQDYMLYATLYAIANPGEYISPTDEGLSSWPAWWRDGEAESFADSYLLGMEQETKKELMQEYHDKLITKRNMVMAEGLRELLESDEPHSYFAIIGLLHLVLPDDSVVSILEDMGYTVERIP